MLSLELSVAKIIKNSSPNFAFWFAAFLLACLAAFLAFYGATKSLWLDEAYSVWVAEQNFASIITALANDTHPPLYYFFAFDLDKNFWYERACRAESVRCVLFG